MKEQFAQEYPQFKAKIHNFIVSSYFNSKTKEYEEMFNQMVSVSPEDMKESIQKSPEFLQARNQSLSLMEKIVTLHKGLDFIFKMEENALAEFCQYDLKRVDQRVAQDLKEAATLLQQFDLVSEKGRKVIEMLEDPFLSQGM